MEKGNKDRVRVFAISGKNESELTERINKFGDEHDVIATQIFQKGNGWIAFLYFKNGVK